MLYQTDLPRDIAAQFLDTGRFGVDTETTGLNPRRDRLCLVQIYNGKQFAAVQIDKEDPQKAENLIGILESAREKVAHFARFDVGMLYYKLGVRFDAYHIYCTKVGNKITRTATPKHGLKDVALDLCGVTLDKAQQCSDWGVETLREEQVTYGRGDVLHLLDIQDKQRALALRDRRSEILVEAMSAIHGMVIADIFEFNDRAGSLYDH